ncbi:hypothetical protein JM84_1432 [Dokdonia sp. Hel_I_63]|uniref:hypothetical protein n=1 Tax=unclassified Dokdonia TaxID=2615033 RepID=UPI00020A7A56|nr:MULTISPECIES: hypothetical protein [unclassified Dokdonia]AEE18239.1 hypothetical protein Krodi_0252 [Dokdonia sp. 4H-3-7-5]TVZ22529.1 hypothetical protein JM84_1432 [Dokdonia sp. Hel_I_63]
MDWSSFEIDDKIFKWEQTFNDVFEVFEHKNLNKNTSSWKLHKVPSNEFLGLDTVSCEFYGPSYDRPISSISFGLKPIKKGWFQQHHSPYMKQLISILGEPDKVQENPLTDGKKYNEGYSSGSVIYAAHWWFGDIRIGLSAYGGIRNESLGETAALLHIGWYNEIAMAKPYINDFYNREARISKQLTLIETFTLSYGQLKMLRRSYELPSDLLAGKEDEIHLAQLALYHANVYRTPKELAQQMQPNQLRLLSLDTTQQYALATKHDFTVFDYGSEIVFTNILPAKGAGATEITVNNLTYRDSPNSVPLSELRTKLKALGFTIKTAEFFDA